MLTSLLILSSVVVPSLANGNRTAWVGLLTNHRNPVGIEAQSETVNGALSPWAATRPEVAIGWRMGSGSNLAKFAWRLVDVGDSSTVVFKEDFTAPPPMDIVINSPADSEIFTNLLYNVTVTFPAVEDSGSPSNIAKREVWDDGDFKPVPWPGSLTVSANNENCSTATELTITVADAAGTSKTNTAVDNVQLVTPEELVYPLNLAITTPTFGAIHANISDTKNLLYATGNGDKVPSLNFTKTFGAAFCTFTGD